MNTEKRNNQTLYIQISMHHNFESVAMTHRKKRGLVLVSTRRSNYCVQKTFGCNGAVRFGIIPAIEDAELTTLSLR